MKKRKKTLTLGGAVVLVIPVILIYFLSTVPMYSFDGDADAALVVTMKHTTNKEHICSESEVKEFLAKEALNERKHLRKRASMCGSRKRVPLRMIVWLDGNEVINTEYLPAGYKTDGSVFIYEKFITSRGKHTIKAVMRDSKTDSDEKFQYRLEKTVELESLQVIVLDFDKTVDMLTLT